MRSIAPLQTRQVHHGRSRLDSPVCRRFPPNQPPTGNNRQTGKRRTEGHTHYEAEGLDASRDDDNGQSAKCAIAHRQRARLRIEAAPQRRRFPRSWRLDLQAQPRGSIICLRRTDSRGRVSLLGHSFAVELTWPHGLVRAHFDLTPEQIRFFAVRRREPNCHHLLNAVAYHLPKTRFTDVRKF